MVTVAENATINVYHTETLINNINAKLFKDFKYEVSIAGLDVLVNNLLDVSMEYDMDEVREMNKSTSIWATYLSEVNSLLSIAIEQYKNVQDIYAYLVHIAIADVEQFQLVAPKYKIDTTNLPYAIKEVETKNKEIKTFVQNLKVIISRLESYEQLMRAGYYKTGRLLRSFAKRERNISFASI